MHLSNLESTLDRFLKIMIVVHVFIPLFVRCRLTLEPFPNSQKTCYHPGFVTMRMREIHLYVQIPTANVDGHIQHVRLVSTCMQQIVWPPGSVNSWFSEGHCLQGIVLTFVL